LKTLVYLQKNPAEAGIFVVYVVEIMPTSPWRYTNKIRSVVRESPLP
jgi:hypothetical protein